MREARLPKRHLLPLVAIVLIAFALRLYRLDADPLWWDEGISIYLAQRDLTDLTSAKDFSVDIHPPVYHAVLAAWRMGAGSSVFATRFLSLLFGVAVVACTYVLGRRLGGPFAGLLAAGLLALSPFHIHHSQESRMYTLVALLGAAYTLLALGYLSRYEKAVDGFDSPEGHPQPTTREGDALHGSAQDAGEQPATKRERHATQRDSRALLVAIALVTGTGLLTFYYFAFLPLAFGLVALLRTRSLGWRGLARLTAAHVLGAILFLPWALVLLREVGGGNTFGVPVEMQTRLDTVQYLAEIGRVFTSGHSGTMPLASTLLFALALVAALLPIRRDRALRDRWSVAALIVLPVVVAYAATQLRPFFYARFLIFSLPSVLALVASGTATVAGLPKGRLPVLSVAWALAIAIGLAGPLMAHYAGGRYAFSRMDFLTQIDDLRRYGQSGDAVVTTYAWQAGYVVAYLPNQRFTLTYLPDPSSEQVAQLLETNGRVWVLSHSPNQEWQGLRAEQTAARLGVSAYTRQQGDARLRLFRRADVQPLRFASNAVAAVGPDFRLIAARIEPSGQLKPGSDLQVELTWQATQQPRRDLTVFVQLLGPDGQVVTQQDNPPLRGTRPTSSFSNGEVLVDPYSLRLPATLAPGSYLLQTGLYHAPSGAREPVNRSPEETDRVILARYTVSR